MNTGKRDKKKTLDWFRDHGFTAEYVETLMWVGGPRRIPIKKDLFGADGVAFDKDNFIFWNSTTRAQVAAHVREFRKFKMPAPIRQLVVIWTPRVKEPAMIDAATYKIRGE